MAELFRYIQQAFVVPSMRPVIDVGRQSDLQDGLRNAISQAVPADRLRSIAESFIVEHFSSPAHDAVQLGKQLLSFARRLAVTSDGTQAVDQLISTFFDSEAAELVGSDPFQSDKALLDDTLVCVKIATAFDRVNAHDLVTMRQAVAFIEDFAAGNVRGDDTQGIGETLRRPIRIPGEFVKALPPPAERPSSPPAPDPAIETAARQRAALTAEQQHLKTAYDTIMGMSPDQFELRPVSAEDSQRDRVAASDRIGGDRPGREESSGDAHGTAATPTFLAISRLALERLDGDVRKALEVANIDVVNEPAADVIAEIKRRWQDVSEQLAPYQAPAPVAVYRVGGHVFAVQESARATARAREAL